MSHARRLRDSSKTLKDFNSDFCEECASAILEQISIKHKLSQETKKSDVDSDPASKRNGDKEKLADNRRVLLTITVEIEEGRVEQVQLKEGDSAESVAVQFCQEHGLPDQFVAPFTEHILSIINEEDRTDDVMFPSPEESMSNDKSISTNGSSLRGGGSPAESRQQLPSTDSAFSCCLPLARREPRKTDARHEKTSQAASQKVVKPLKRCCCCGSSLSPRRKTSRRRKKRGRKTTFSDRLMAPTFTSLAKNPGALHHCLKKSRTRIRPLSEQAKAVCMRLYNEPIGHCHPNKRCRNGVKRTYRVARRREGLSKKSWLLSRMRGKIAKQYRNYGLMLYAEGRQQQQNHIKAVHERAKQVETRELAEVTLMPKISKRSRNMRKSQDHVWRRLQSCNRFKQDALQELRQEVWEARYMECTFRPQINQTWRTNGQEIDGDYYSNRFEQLFLDADHRRRRRAECMQWHPEGVTFQPSINRGIPHETTSSMTDDDVSQECSVFRRLLDNAAEVMEKKQMQEQLSHRPFDRRTGRELFKPHIGRKPLNRDHSGVPVGEYLHRMNCAFNNKIRRLVARENRVKKEQARARYVGPNSQRLVERLKDRGFQQVFDFLDTDKDGYVDLTTANFDRLNSDVIDDLKRVMKMSRGKEKLRYKTFEDLMLETEEKYHPEQQVHLGLKHRRHHDGDHCTFKFRMDKLSRRLAKERRKYSTHEQWWQIIFAEYIANLQKMEKWRKERQHQQMAECTFKPYLISVPATKGSAATPRGGIVQSIKDGVGQTITDMYEKVQQKVLDNQREGYYLQNDRGGSEVMEMQGLQQMMEMPSTQQVVEMLGKTNKSASTQLSVRGRKKKHDVISNLDDLPKTNMGMFLGLMGA